MFFWPFCSVVPHVVKCLLMVSLEFLFLHGPGREFHGDRVDKQMTRREGTRGERAGEDKNGGMKDERAALRRGRPARFEDGASGASEPSVHDSGLVSSPESS